MSGNGGMRPMSKKRRAEIPARRLIVEQALQRDGGCTFQRARDAYRAATGLDISQRALRALPDACGGRLEVNEIIRRSQWAAGYLVLDNTITLCSDHHRFVTEWPDDAHVLGLQRKSYERPA